MKTLAVLGGLALAAASQAIADDRDYRSPGWRQPESPRFEQRRQARLQVVAHEIDELAQRIALGTTGARYARSPYQAQAIRRVRVLAEEADRFHTQVERRHADFGRTMGDYRALSRSFDRADATFGALRAPIPMRRDFERLSRRMEELNDLFDRRWDEHDNRRYQHDRFDDDDRQGDRPGRGN